MQGHKNSSSSSSRTQHNNPQELPEGGPQTHASMTLELGGFQYGW